MGNFLCNSETKGKLFCFVCKVTDLDGSAQCTKVKFDKWNNVLFLLLISQVKTEQKYWQIPLGQNVAVIVF